MKRVLVVLLLVSLLPAASAADGVELAADAAAKDLAVNAQANQGVQATVGYTLDLAAATPLRLLSSVKGGPSGDTPVPHNATWRLDGNVLGTTSGQSTLVINSVAAGRHPVVVVWSLGGQASGTLALQAFARRDVSGEGGSAAGVGGSLAQTSLKVTRSAVPATGGPAAVGGATPTVLALSYERRADGTSLSWSSSLPASSTLVVSGAGVAPVSRLLPSNTRFTTDLGNLPDGVYDYNITAREPGGRTGSLAGRFRLQGLGTGTPLSAQLEQSLSAALKQPVPTATIFLLDQDRDGHPDHVLDASGLVTELRALTQQGRFVLRASEGGALLLLEANTGAVRPMQAVAGQPGADAATGTTRRVAVAVPEKAGWILVTVQDPHPDEAILNVQRGDGSPLPKEAIWQENGVVQFVDDPAASYTLLYTVPPAPGFPLGTALAFLAFGLLGGAAVSLLVRRRMK